MRKPLSVKETSNLLGVSIPMVYKLVKSKQIRSFRLGDRWIIPADAIDELLSVGKEETTNAE
jgi:excisionase family DNA binding protein